MRTRYQAQVCLQSCGQGIRQLSALGYGNRESNKTAFRIVDKESSKCLPWVMRTKNPAKVCTVFKNLEKMFLCNCFTLCTIINLWRCIQRFNKRREEPINVAVNNAIHHIFGFCCWQNIRQIHEFYHYKSIEDLFSIVRQRFLNAIVCHKNETLKFLSQLLRESEDKEQNMTPWPYSNLLLDFPFPFILFFFLSPFLIK